MAKIEVDLGHNIRAWTEFTIADATNEEVAVLGRLGSSEAVEMLSTMLKAGRAVEGETTYEDNPPMFDGASEADVIDVRGEDD